MLTLKERSVSGFSIEITEDQGNDISDAMTTLRALHTIENLFSLVCEAFVELETELFSHALEHLTGSNAELSNKEVSERFDRVRHRINLKTLTLLNAHAAFSSQTPQTLNSNSSLNRFLEPQRRLIAKAFDESLNYRIFCAVRNFAQHSALPIHGAEFSVKNQWKDNKNTSSPSRGRVTFSPYLSTMALSKSSKIRRATRDEIENRKSSSLDLKAVCRGAISAFCRAHREFSDLTESVLTGAMLKVDNVYEDASEKKGSEAKFLHLFIDPSVENDTGIFLDRALADRIRVSRARWRGLDNIERLFISTEVIFQRDRYCGDTSKIWVPD